MEQAVNRGEATLLQAKKKTKKYNVRESLLGVAFVSPWIAGFLLLMAFPIGYSVYLSMTNTITQSFIVDFKGLDNFKQILTDLEVWRSLGHTCIFVALSVPANIVFSLVLALLLNAKTKGKKVYRALYYIPTLVTSVAVAFLWKQIFNYNEGVLNSFLRLFGIQGPAWLQDYFWATPSLVLMGMWSVGGIVVIFSAAMTDVPVNLYEAANIDGASSVRKFFTITLPMLSPIIFYNILTTTVAGFQMFLQPMLMTGGNYNTRYIGLLIYNTAFMGKGQIGYASAMSWLLLVVVLTVTAVIKLLEKKLVFYND